MKLHTFVKHNKIMCHTRTITLACIFLEIFPFDDFKYNFVSTQFKTAEDNLMKFHTFVMHDEKTSCTAIF